MKFAFVENVPGANPEDYFFSSTTENNTNNVYGVDGMEKAGELVKELSKQGFEFFNFCGDFTEDNISEYSKEVTASMKCCKYSDAESEKMEKLASLMEYGMIIYEDEVKTIVRKDIKHSGCNTYIRLVNSMEDAIAVAMELKEQKIDFIELCGWFDAEKTEKIIEAVNGELPVGSCGL